MSCGAPLGEPEAPEQGRKTVTILFTDLVGSTALAEQLDAESIADLMTAYFDAMRAIVVRHDGTIGKFLGDAVLAVFGVPHLHEDDALRAVRVATEMRDAVGDLNASFASRWGVTIATRTGVNTGVVATVGMVAEHDFIAGDTANVAARLEQAAGAGEILISGSTYRLVRRSVDAERLPPIALKGKAELAEVHRVLRVRAPSEEPPDDRRTRLVGRTKELETLQWTLERATEDRTCRLVTVLGAAGVGKSRLVLEFLEAAGADATVLRGRCLPYGDGTMFWPLVEIVKEAAAIADDDEPADARAKLEARLAGAPDAGAVADRLAQLVGIVPAAAAAEAPSFAVARLFREVSRDRPVVAVIEDLHWAEPTLLSLVEEVASTSTGVPLVIVAVARPEFADDNPTWGGATDSTTLELGPLSEAECERMVSLLLGLSAGLQDIRDRIADAAAGNPLYAEQLVSMLIDDGVLVRTASGLTSETDLTTLAVPPGIHALLSDRLERLDRDARAVIGPAAVMGLVFYRDALHALAPTLPADRVSSVLTELVRKDLVRPSRSDIVGQEAFAFRHQLIRDVAYERLSKRPRAVLHEQFADWFEAAMGPRADEFGEILGHHLEQAYRYRTELGQADAAALATASRAATWLARAGWRSSALGDAAAGVALRRRALTLMPADAPGRSQVLAELGDALLWRGLFDEARQMLGEAVASTSDADARPRALARLSQLRLDFQVDSAADYGAIEREALEAAHALEAAGDDFGAARAWRVVYWARWGMCRLDEMRPAAERAYDHDRRSRDPHYPQDDLIGVLVSLVWGPTPASVALTEGLEIQASLRGHAGAEAFATCFLGQLHGMLGKTESAREMIERGIATRRTLGDLPGAAMTQAEGLGYFCSMVIGDWERALRDLEQGHAALREMQDRNYLAVTCGWIAHALLELGRTDDAMRFVDECRAAAADGWVAAQVLWRGAAARIAVRRGDAAQADRLAREAVDLALRTDRVDTQTDALMDLADVLRVLGRPAEAADAAAQALARYERKEVLPAAARARLLIADLRRIDADGDAG